MNYLCVCSGIGAATVAWAPLGWAPVAFAEIEPFPCAVLAHHWPDVPNLGNMTKYESWTLGSSIDLLVGGTPCQAFSVSGRRGGLNDARGNLALTFCEIAEKHNPEWVLWENVPGVLSDRTNAFGCLLGRLCGSDSALLPPAGRSWPSAGLVSGPSRTVAWRVLDAQYFGVAQQRKRVFVLASRGPRNWRCAAALLPIGDGVQGDPAAGRKAQKDLAGTIDASAARSRGAGHNPGMITGTLTKSMWRRGGVPDGADTPGQLICGALTAGDPRRGFRNSAEEAASGRIVISHDPACTLTRREFKGPLPEADLSTVVAFRHWASAADTGVPQEGITPALRSGDTSGQCVAFEQRYFTRDNKTGGKPSDLVSLTATGAAKAGDAAPCVAFSGRSRGDDGRGYDRPPNVTGDIAGTLDTVKPGNVAGPSIGVRRLTPRECERLQGFPDDFTRIPVPILTALDIEPDPDNEKHWIKDSPRYAAIGNSMAVPVMSWIAQRIEFVRNNF